ncbi:hypothetical protein Tco_1149492 [Tanacetum coccineum]
MKKPKVQWCKAISQEKEYGPEYWASCDPYSDVCDGGDLPNDKEKCCWESTNDKQLSDDEDNMDLPDEGEEYEDPEECKEDKVNTIFRVVIDKLNNDWFNGTSEDEDDLERIIDYLEPTSYDGFIDLGNEAYKKRKNKLLGITYMEPPLILIEKVEVTRYTIGPGESYIKVRILGIDELPRTKSNVAIIQARLMEEMDEERGVLRKT